MKLSQKETNILAFLIFIVVCAMCSCSKSNEAPQGQQTGKTTVILYSTNAAVNSLGVTLQIGGTTVGGLVYSATAPDCGDGKEFAETKLAPGTYKVDYIPYGHSTPTKQVSLTVTKSATCQTFDLN